MARQRLPDRREHRTQRFAWGALQALVSVGFDHQGAGREVFIDSEGGAGWLRVGSDLYREATIACVLVSRLLQQDDRLETLLASVLRLDLGGEGSALEDDYTGVVKPSLFTALLAAAVRVELEEGDQIRGAHGALALGMGETR